MNQVRLFRSPVESCRFQFVMELATHEYSMYADANPAPSSVIDMLLMVAVPVVVVMVPVEMTIGAVLSIRFTVAVASPVFPPLSWN